MGKPRAATAATSNHFRRRKPDRWLERALDAALQHGEATFEADHEVGDLQDLVRDCWGLMTPEQRDVIKTDPHWQEFLEQWGARG